MRTTPAALALLLALAAPAAADRADDDLSAVKKAVAASAGAQAKPPAEEPPATTSEAKPGPRKSEPQWFRVRVVEKAGRPRLGETRRGERTRVSINLPLGLVRALGEDWPLEASHRCDRDHRRCATLGEVLRALDSGQSLVEIEDDEATVRVWVE